MGDCVVAGVLQSMGLQLMLLEPSQRAQRPALQQAVKKPAVSASYPCSAPLRASSAPTVAVN